MPACRSCKEWMDSIDNFIRLRNGAYHWNCALEKRTPAEREEFLTKLGRAWIERIPFGVVDNYKLKSFVTIFLDGVK